jgi:hypothetical protein
MSLDEPGVGGGRGRGIGEGGMMYVEGKEEKDGSEKEDGRRAEYRWSA